MGKENREATDDSFWKHFGLGKECAVGLNGTCSVLKVKVACLKLVKESGDECQLLLVSDLSGVDFDWLTHELEKFDFGLKDLASGIEQGF